MLLIHFFSLRVSWFLHLLFRPLCALESSGGPVDLRWWTGGYMAWCANAALFSVGLLDWGYRAVVASTGTLGLACACM